MGTLLPSDRGQWGSYLEPRSFQVPTYHTHGHTHTHTHVHATTHKHLCHLGSAAWYWHRVTHNPKCLLSQPTMFRAQGNKSSHLLLSPWNTRCSSQTPRGFEGDATAGTGDSGRIRTVRVAGACDGLRVMEADAFIPSDPLPSPGKIWVDLEVVKPSRTLQGPPR